MDWKEIFNKNNEKFSNSRDRSREWEQLKEKCKDATKEELVYLIMFMQVFGADIILEHLRQIGETGNEPEKMTMELADIENSTGCIEINLETLGDRT